MNSSLQQFSESHSFLSIDIGRDIQVHWLKRYHRQNEKIQARLNQIADAASPLRKIDEASCHALAKLIPNYNYDDAGCIMKFYFPPTVNLKGATFATAMQIVNGVKDLKTAIGQQWSMAVTNTAQSKAYETRKK